MLSEPQSVNPEVKSSAWGREVHVCETLCIEAYSRHFRNVTISLLLTFLSLLGLSKDLDS